MTGVRPGSGNFRHQPEVATHLKHHAQQAAIERRHAGQWRDRSIANPYAGRYSESLDELIAIGEEIGALLGEKAVKAFGIEHGIAQSSGIAAHCRRGLRARACRRRPAPKAGRATAPSGGERRGNTAIGKEAGHTGHRH